MSMNSNEDKGDVKEKISNQGLTSNAELSVALIEESKCLGLLKQTIWEKACLRHPVAGL